MHLPGTYYFLKNVINRFFPSIDILWIISLVMYIPIQIKYRMIISIKNKKFKGCVLFVGFFFSDILVAIQQC